MDISVTISRGKKFLPGASPVVPGYIVGDAPDPNQPTIPVNTADTGIGIKLNDKVIGGVKRVIESSESLDIPEFWQYNIRGLTLDVDGVVENNGEINIG